MKKKKTYLTSPFWLFGIMFIVFISYFLYILVFFILPKSNLERTSLAVIWGMRTMFCIIPTLMLIGFANKCFSIVKIKEDGIYKSLFGCMFKLQFLWSEIEDIKIVNRFDQWLFISKTSMEGLKYEQLQKDKNILHMSGRPEVYKALQENTSIEF